MANVLFKRGLQQSLPSQGVDGVFYLTTDTNRLYIGQGSGKKPVLLNQTVNFIESVEKLVYMSDQWDATEKESHLQDLYYVMPDGGDGTNSHNGNILAVWSKNKTDNKYSWVQINPDHNTFIETVSQLVAASGNTNEVKITTSISQNDGSNAKMIEFTVAGSGKTIKVEAKADGKGYTLTGDTYTLSRPAAGEIRLNSNLGQDSSSIKLIAGSKNVTIGNGTNNNEIKIDAVDTVNTAASLTLGADGKLTMIVTDSNSETVSSSTDAITMKYGANGGLSAPIGGTLNVYSKDDIDTKFKNLNGLTYIGTIGDGGVYTIAGNDFSVYTGGTTKVDVHNGDMFLVAGRVKYGTDSFAETGDLLIASGTETDGVLSTITWTYVPSGDDAKLDTTYNFDGDATKNSMTIRSVSSLDAGDTAVAGEISFEAGADQAIAISSAVSGNTADHNEKLKVTIGHANVSHTEGNGADIYMENVDSVNVITGVAVNDQGHVKEITKTKIFAREYKLADYPDLKDGTLGDVKYVTVKQGLQIGDNDPVLQKTGYKLQSANLDVKIVENNVQIDFAWGSF